jgi:HisJ family histidinol phosphate phosphatase
LLNDDHVHGGREWSGHSPEYTTLAEVAAAARERGLRASLREHAPLPPAFVAAHPGALRETPGTGWPVGLRLAGTMVDGRPVAPELENLDRFLAEVAGAGLPLGFEIDVLGGAWLAHSIEVMELLERRAAGHGLEIECFNLSHHYPWDMSFGGLQQALTRAGGPGPFLRGYFAAIRAYAATGLFGAVSHMEAVRKFDHLAPSPSERPFALVLQLYRAEIAETLDAMRQYGVALEYNTAGHDSWGRPYLSPETLQAAVELGIGIVVGSDSHRPASVGRQFAAAAAELGEVGLTEVTTFRRRKAVRVPLRQSELEEQAE